MKKMQFVFLQKKNEKREKKGRKRKEEEKQGGEEKPEKDKKKNRRAREREREREREKTIFTAIKVEFGEMNRQRNDVRTKQVGSFFRFSTATLSHKKKKKIERWKIFFGERKRNPWI